MKTITNEMSHANIYHFNKFSDKVVHPRKNKKLTKKQCHALLYKLNRIKIKARMHSD